MSSLLHKPAAHWLLLTIIVVLGLFLRLFHLGSTMPFIGDQAWFYLSARAALLTGTFPLLGITSSVTWLHQGSLYTYLLIPELALTRFHPLSGGVLTALLGGLSIILIYYLGRLWFSKPAALSAAFVAATSPLLVIHSRMPYHTSPIPLFMAIMLILLHRRRLFLSFLFLGFLYQLELATIIYWPVLVIFLISRRVVPRLVHLLGFLIGILPLLLSGPISAGGTFAWLGYRFIKSLNSVIVSLSHFASASPFPDQSLATFSHLDFYHSLLERFFFPGLPLVAPVVLGLTILLCFRRPRIIWLWLIVPLVTLFFSPSGSEAYFTLLFVPLSLFMGHFFSQVFPKSALLFLFSGLWLIHTHFLLSRDFAISPASYGAALSSRLELSRHILSLSSTSLPHLQSEGPGSQFATTVLPYRYLVWWLGLSQPAAGTNLKFSVNDSAQTFRVLQ